MSDSVIFNCYSGLSGSTTLDIYAAAFAEREAQALGAVANVLTGSLTNKKAE